MLNDRPASRLTSAALLLVVAFGAVVSPAAPRRQSGPKEGSLSVAVTGKGGAPVVGLPREAFALTSGKHALEITSFESGGPAAVAALFDLSNSVAGAGEGRLRPAAEAMWRLVSAGHESNEYRVVAFADEVKTVLAGSRERQAVRDALVQIHGAQPGRQSSLLDACWETLNALSTSPHARRALILLSDGEDTYSRAQKEDILGQLREGAAVVYTVAIGPKPAPPPGVGDVRSRGQQLLDKLAEVSGGLSCSPRNAKEMDACFARIGEDLRARYVITFKSPEPPEPGKCRPVKARATPPAGSADKSLKVRAREEFCAPRPQK